MAFTEAHRQALKEAIASGARLVKFGERWMEYQSVDQMRQALSLVEAELAGSNGQTVRRQIRISTSKGL